MAPETKFKQQLTSFKSTPTHHPLAALVAMSVKFYPKLGNSTAVNLSATDRTFH